MEPAATTLPIESAGLTGFHCPSCGKAISSGETDFHEEAISHEEAIIRKQAMQASNERLHCQTCKKTWPVNQGVPVFTDHDFSWTPVRAELMDQLVEESLATGDWRKAVLDHEDEIPPYTRRYIMDEDRADWLFLMPVRRDWRVLDVGSGWGSVSIPLSRWVGEIFCADPTLANCRFLKARAEQEGVENLRVFQANPLDYPSYPFAPASFDLIVLNGVLEWTGNGDLDTPVRDLQIRALKALKNLLKPGGRIYIGIENRFAYGALFGEAVHHELPFTGLMPRPLANAAMKLFKGRPHRTHIHGMSGYRKLLRAAGFSQVDFYLPRPSYRDLFWLIPANTGQGVKIWARRLARAETWTRRIIRWWAQRLPIRGIWPSYSMVCKKEKEALVPLSLSSRKRKHDFRSQRQQGKPSMNYFLPEKKENQV